MCSRGSGRRVELIIQWRHDPTRHEAELDAKARKEAKAKADDANARRSKPSAPPRNSNDWPTRPSASEGSGGGGGAPQSKG